MEQPQKGDARLSVSGSGGGCCATKGAQIDTNEIAKSFAELRIAATHNCRHQPR